MDVDVELAALHDETIRFISALQAARESLAASQSRIAEDGGARAAQKSGATETDARAACARRAALVVRDIESTLVRSDELLERLQAAQEQRAARTADVSHQLKFAGQVCAYLDGMYEAWIFNALKDRETPVRQARALVHVRNVAGAIANARFQKFKIAEVRAAALVQLREALLDAVRSKNLLPQEFMHCTAMTTADFHAIRKADVDAITTANLEDVIQPSHSARVNPTLRKAVANFVASLKDYLSRFLSRVRGIIPFTELLIYRGAMLTPDDFQRELRAASDVVLSFTATFCRDFFLKTTFARCRDYPWPVADVTDEEQENNARLLERWIQVIVESQRRRFVVEPRDRLVEDIVGARAILSQISDGDERRAAAAQLPIAALDDLAHRGDDMTSVCLAYLAGARRTDEAAGALEGVRQTASPQMLKQKPKPKPKPKSKPESKARSKPRSSKSPVRTRSPTRTRR